MSETQTLSSPAAEKASPSNRPASNQHTGNRPAALTHPDRFLHRHIGPSQDEQRDMARGLGFSSLDELISAAIPPGIRAAKPLELAPTLSEHEALARLKSIANKNQVLRSFIGMGYHDCFIPPVIQRNILENPGWYTPYTPYQAEIAQGRLEGLLNFQTMVCDLTGLEVANASLLDEATAAAEAMMMCHRQKAAEGRERFLVAEDCHPQNIDVVRTRAKPQGIDVVVSASDAFHFDNTVFGVLIQYPATDGAIRDYRSLIEKAHAAGALVVVATDLLALTLLRPPEEFGADIAVGSAQRLGVPLGYGGPHAAFFATRDACKRQMPGRLVGVSKDSRGRPALRLSLGTREQHIRREKATSNICTAQALLANMAMAYAVYHGPEGLRQIARRVHFMANLLALGLEKLGLKVGRASSRSAQAGCPPWFDTLRIDLGSKLSTDIVRIAESRHVNLRVFDPHTMGLSLDETVTENDLQTLLQIFNDDRAPSFPLEDLSSKASSDLPVEFARTSRFLTHPVFNRYHSETEMLRYLRKLESRDLSLCHSMIPLGSCTMKLNATCEMLPISWPEFNRIHPFAPLKQTRGYQMLFEELEHWLAEITGFAGISLQPNAGSQGEYAGLLIIRAFHSSRGEAHRNVCLIPTSAHGTNPASAVMAGLKVVAVACDADGNIDLADLRSKAEAHKTDLAALMITYPSTHGVFEETIREVCNVIHHNGGQVYMDGANMNAQVGLCRPAEMGADVCHLNLHKTFCIPHGGGGPGMGPIGAAEHLVPFLPGHPVVNLGGEDPIGAVAAAPWGSASILTISWIYIAAMGDAGLAEATKVAILNANYIARRLHSHFPVLY
ncbi:MAG: aminomethyl-transferring glycine dehydrogenase, partial [Verrucomicrobia bacterium]|nr:aminomethyl-transferring glycine dehydrogenase [Verrucomicrobiota bacterium]